MPHNGVVVAPQPIAAETGADILAAGGTAFDAAVAAALVQTVVDPFMCGIGGIGVAQIHNADSGDTATIDFYGRVGSRALPDQWAKAARRSPEGKTYVKDFPNHLGYRSILVPATVAGLAAVHARGGRLPWRDLVLPAARIARDGFPFYAYITDYFLDTHQYPRGEHVPPFDRFIRATPAMSALWHHPDGRLFGVGDHFANPDYAATLTHLAEAGPDDFYRGALAERIAADFAANDALVTAADLADCRAIVRAPLRGSYRGHDLATASPGGTTILQTLNILEGYDLGRFAHGSTDHLHLVASAMRLAFGDRARLTGEQAQDEATIAQLVGKDRAAELRARIAPADLPTTAAADTPGTTHLTVADRHGNVVAMTHTLALGSGVVTPGLGFIYNNGMHSFDPLPGKPNSITPGKARLSAMSPTIVFRDGQPYAALGSPGSNAIVNAVAQVISNLLDFGHDPATAVAVPRIHCEGGATLLESRTPRAVATALAALGHQPKPRPFAYDSLQGRIQLVVATPDRWLGASDPRRDGGIAAYA
jgi:gamma-glutamyltranspeptidase / glutathione hydrolase